MAKTNYTKVEGALDEGLRKITVNKLLDIADEVEGTKDKEAEAKTTLEMQLLTALHQELKHLHKQGKDPYKKLGINKKEIKNFIEKAETLTTEDWAKIKELKGKIDEFRKELDKLSQVSDADLVDQERRKHINKRFNTNEKWLPLH